MKEILKDLLTGALPFWELFDFLHWFFFKSYLDDEIRLVQEN